MEGIDPRRPTRKESWKGWDRLEVTLTPDPGLDIVPHHSNAQSVIKGQRYREWSWGVFPKNDGPHQLSLLVQGVHGSEREDYDPEMKQWNVEFNFWYWLKNGMQQNGIGWIWTIALAAATWGGGYITGKRKAPPPPPPSPPPSTPPHEPRPLLFE